MEIFNALTRRESLKKLIQLSGAIALGRIGFWAFSTSPTTEASVKGHGFLVEGKGNKGYLAGDLVRAVFEAAGGMKKYISPGDVVVIKPNLSWARTPQFAATTSPEVLRSVVELCQEAGAKKVRIVDHTIHDARRCFALSGAGRVAEQTGADLVFPRSTLMRRMKIRGERLDVWPVFMPVVEGDKLINLPVAKHHSLTKLTLGMKNWIGAVGGSRWSLHQDINQSIVDLAGFFRPTVTLIDAIRVLTRNGPSGGSTADVKEMDTLILSDDPVAADAKAALLFGERPERLGFVRLGQKWGLGTYDFGTLDNKKVRV